MKEHKIYQLYPTENASLEGLEDLLNRGWTILSATDTASMADNHFIVYVLSRSKNVEELILEYNKRVENKAKRWQQE